jgi:hypothetical protein
MQRAIIPGSRVSFGRLGVGVEWVVFGRIHRLGPLDGDDPDRRWPGGRPRVVCSGSWQYEPLLVHRASPPHPYWPGGAVLIEPGAHRRAIGLLDNLAEDLLH